MNSHTRLRNLHKLNSISSLRFCFSTNAAVAVEDLNRKHQVGSNPNNQIYTHLLNTCKQECELFQSRHVFDKMPQWLSQAAKNCKLIHAQTLKFGFGLNGELGNAIVDLYSKCGVIDFAWKVFDQLDKRDELAWNSIMSMYERLELPEEVVRVFRLMWNSNTPSNQHTFASVLKACWKLAKVGLGREVHSGVIKTGFYLNSFCGSSLIHMYAKCDCLIEARRVFDGLDKPDTISWTTMIASYVRVGLPEEALKLSKEMQRVGVKPDQVALVTIVTACVSVGRLEDAINWFSQMSNPTVVAWNVMISGLDKNGFAEEAVSFFRNMNLACVKSTRSTLASVISAIAKLSALDQGQQVHCEAIKLGLGSNVYVGSSLINMYSNCQTMESARKVFDEVDIRNTVLWNAMLKGYAQNGHPFEVVECFSSMRSSSLKPDEFTYTSVLSAISMLESLEMGRQLHSFITKSNGLNLFVGNALVDMYAKSGDIKDARCQFELMKERDNVSWNAIIVGYVQEDEKEAFRMFRKMIFDGFVPEEFSVSSVLSGCASVQALEQGKQVHCFLVKLGLDLNNYPGSSLVDMYAMCGDMEAANKVLTEMLVQTVVSRNSLIKGYIQSNNAEEALNQFQEILAEGLKPSNITFASILAACSEPSGRQVHCYTFKSGGLHNDVILGVSLLGMYLRSLSSEDANKLFLEFPKPRSRVLWTCMISGHAHNGYDEEALRFFREMRSDDALPDQATFTSVLSACSGSAALQDGKEVHCLIFRMGFNLDKSTCSALVDMYAKCGDIECSVKAFKEMDSKEDAISWNSMIFGFANNGYAEDALRIFDQMKHANVEPDDITFLGLLTACSHGGRVSEGREFFNVMIKYYGIQPREDHYACMVDILGRGGYLKEAEELIDDLPFEPDCGIWTTFLAACKLYGDEVRGKRAAEKLIVLEPHNSSSYVLLHNLYAASEKWDGAKRIRKSMRQRGVRKLPGCSWISLGTKTDLFVAGDKCHPSAGEVRAVLKDLTALMRDHGYVVTTDSVLDEEETFQ